MSRPYLRKDQPKQETTFTGIPIGSLPADPRIRAPTMDRLWKDHSRAIRGEPV